MPGFNRENACDRPCVGSWHGWDCQHERKEEKSLGGCILVGLAEVYPGGQEVLEWKLAAGGVLCHPGTSCLGIAALCSPEGSVASVQTAAGSQIAAAGVRPPTAAPCSWRSLRHILTPCRRVSYRGLRQLEKAKSASGKQELTAPQDTHTHTECVGDLHALKGTNTSLSAKSCALEKVPELLWAWSAGMGTILSRWPGHSQLLSSGDSLSFFWTGNMSSRGCWLKNWEERREMKKGREGWRERVWERKLRASDSHPGLHSVLCVRQRTSQESPVSPVKFPQREVTLAAGLRKLPKGEIESSQWLWWGRWVSVE